MLTTLCHAQGSKLTTICHVHDELNLLYMSFYAFHIVLHPRLCPSTLHTLIINMPVTLRLNTNTSIISTISLHKYCMLSLCMVSCLLDRPYLLSFLFFLTDELQAVRIIDNIGLYHKIIHKSPVKWNEKSLADPEGAYANVPPPPAANRLLYYTYWFYLFINGCAPPPPLQSQMNIEIFSNTT